MIPLFDIKPKKSEIKQYLNLYKKNLLKADFIQGQQVKELEKALSNYTGIKYVQTCANGTDALVISLKSLNLKKNSYVITTPFSWISTAHAIINSGLTPLFVDVKINDFNLDIEEIKKAYEKYKKKVSCVLSVDLFGAPNDNDKIYNFCKLKKIKFLIDGAQSFGSTINRKSSFKFCDIATTSFFPTKPLGCYGDGGAIFTKNKILKNKIRSLCFNGIDIDKSKFKTIGLNSRLDTIQASVLLKKLKNLDKKLNFLRKIFFYYNKNLSEHFMFQKIKSNYKSSHALLSIITERMNRKEAMNVFKKNKIETKIYYPVLMSKQKSIKKNSKIYGKLKIANYLTNNIFSISFNKKINLKIIGKIKNYLNSHI
jgi:UDP-2-acetamido-2-deoxy-ribo-hexuluronate aminotransferase